jgi:hypothetical protein
MVKKIYQNSRGGLNQRGRNYFNRTTGSNLKAPLRKGTSPRRISFAARFGNMSGSLGTRSKPTRLALALKRWGFSNKVQARSFASRHKKK